MPQGAIFRFILLSLIFFWNRLSHYFGKAGDCGARARFSFPTGNFLLAFHISFVFRHSQRLNAAKPRPNFSPTISLIKSELASFLVNQAARNFHGKSISASDTQRGSRVFLQGWSPLPSAGKNHQTDPVYLVHLTKQSSAILNCIILAVDNNVLFQSPFRTEVINRSQGITVAIVKLVFPLQPVFELRNYASSPNRLTTLLKPLLITEIRYLCRQITPVLLSVSLASELRTDFIPSAGCRPVPLAFLLI